MKQILLIYVFLNSALFSITQSYSQITDLPITLTLVGEWGTEGEHPGQFKNPEAIAVDPAGNIYIADTGNHRIQKFTLHGDFINHVGGFGWEQDQFNTPVSIAAVNGLDVFVADSYNSRIKRYDKDLNLISAFSLDENEDYRSTILYPASVCQSSFGDIYCLDKIDNKVIKYTTDGIPLSIIGDINAGRGRLNRPVRLYVDRKNMIYIPDSGSHCVKVYDLHGNFISDLGEGFFEQPDSIIEISDGTFLISDISKGELSLFSSENRLLGILGSEYFDINNVSMAKYREFLLFLNKKSCSVIIYRIQTDAG